MGCDDEQIGQHRAVCRLNRIHERNMRALHAGSHRTRVIEAKQTVCIVDQHVEVLEKILAEDSLNVQVGGLEILEIIDNDPLVSDGARTRFEQVQLRDGSRLTRSRACDDSRALGFQVESSGQRRIDHGDLGAGVQLEVVGSSVVDGYSQNNQV